MRPNPAYFAILAVLTLAGCNVETPIPPLAEWNAYTSPDGAYSVTFPLKPKSQSHQAPTPVGNLKFDMIYNELNNGRAVLSVAHVTYPVAPENYDAQAGIDGVIDGAYKQMGGAITSEEVITVNGMPGKSVSAKMKAGHFKRGIVVIDPNGPTVFQVQAEGPEDFVNSKTADDFLASVKLVPKK